MHMKCSPAFIVVKSPMSMNSKTPFMVLRPARRMNWPAGLQKRWLAVLRSYFLRRAGVWPVFTP